MTEISEEDFSLFQEQKEEIKESMSKEHFEEIKERMKSDHEQIIVRNVKTFQEFEKIINDQQQIIDMFIQVYERMCRGKYQSSIAPYKLLYLWYIRRGIFALFMTKPGDESAQQRHDGVQMQNPSSNKCLLSLLVT